MCCDSWGHKESDTTEQLKWTEYLIFQAPVVHSEIFHFVCCHTYFSVKLEAPFFLICLSEQEDCKWSIFWWDGTASFENLMNRWVAFLPLLYGDFQKINYFFHSSSLKLLFFRCSDCSETLNWNILVWNEYFWKNFLRFTKKVHFFSFKHIGVVQFHLNWIYVFANQLCFGFYCFKGASLYIHGLNISWKVAFGSRDNFFLLYLYCSDSYRIFHTLGLLVYEMRIIRMVINIENIHHIFFMNTRLLLYIFFLSSQYIVHCLLTSSLMLGKVESRRRRGRQKMRWLETITDAMDMNLGKLWEMRLSSHLIFWAPLLLLPSIFSSIRVFSNESSVHSRWPK